MKTVLPSALAAGLLVSFSCFAAAPAGAPAGSTGLCKDGTYYSGAEKKGACGGHKGVKEWWGEAATPKSDAKTEKKAEAKPSMATTSAAVPATKPATTAATGTAAAATAVHGKTEAPKPAAVAAAGGGAGKVWANESTKVYHCSGDKWYGKTKQGEYMTEAEAKAKGFKPDHGKACQ